MVDRKRQDAPGRLELIRAFVNTRDLEEETEALDSPAALAAWLAEAELADGELVGRPADLRRALEVREALRSALLEHVGEAGEHTEPGLILDAAARRARLRLAFGPGCEIAVVTTVSWSSTLREPVMSKVWPV